MAEDLVKSGTDTRNVNVVRAKRLPTRNNKPGLVKIEFRSLEEKISVLRNKQNLKNHNFYNRGFIRSSKTHAERLQEAYLNVLLQDMPYCNQFRLAGNGRLVRIGNSYSGQSQQTYQGSRNSSQAPGVPYSSGPSGVTHFPPPHWQNTRLHSHYSQMRT